MAAKIQPSHPELKGGSGSRKGSPTGGGGDVDGEQEGGVSQLGIKAGSSD